MHDQLINNKQGQLDIMCTLKVYFDVVIFAETWNSALEVIYNLIGCNHFVNGTSTRGEGGSLLTRGFLKCTLVPEFTAVYDSYETVMVQDRTNVVFLLIYRPPGTDISVFFCTISRCLIFL